MRSYTKTSFISVVWRGKCEFWVHINQNKQYCLKGSRVNPIGALGDELSHYYVLQSLPPFYQTFFKLSQRGYNFFPPVTWRYLEFKNNKIIISLQFIVWFPKARWILKFVNDTDFYLYIYICISYMYMKGNLKTTTCIIATLDNLSNCTLLHTELQSSLWLLSEKQCERRTELSPKDNIAIKQT